MIIYVCYIFLLIDISIKFSFFFLIFQTGHIRTSTGSYFIEPVEEWVDHATPITHKFYRIATPPESLNLHPRRTSNCAVDGKFFIIFTIIIFTCLFESIF